MELNALVVGDPFFSSGGAKRCLEVISRYKNHGVRPYLVAPPCFYSTETIKRILPKLAASGVITIGLDLSVKFTSLRWRRNLGWLLNARDLSALTSQLVHRLLSSMRKIRFDFVIGHHELPEVIQMTQEIAEELELPSSAVLQLPPFYANMKKAVKLKLLDDLQFSLAPTYRSLLPDYYRSIYSSVPNHRMVGDIIREPLQTVPMMRYLKSEISKNLGCIDNILAVSKSIPYEMGGTWIPRIRVLQPALAPDKMLVENHGNKGEKEHIMYYARLIPTKGILEIPLIWKAFIRHSGGKYDLHIAGRFENQQTEEIFKTLVRRLGVGGSVKYLGYLDRPTLVHNIACARAMLYPSHLDSYSLMVLESLVLGKQVITYDIPAMKMNFSRNDGVEMVSEFDVDGMAWKLRQSIEEPIIRREMAPSNWDQVVESEIEFAKSLQ